MQQSVGTASVYEVTVRRATGPDTHTHTSSTKRSGAFHSDARNYPIKRSLREQNTLLTPAYQIIKNLYAFATSAFLHACSAPLVV